MLKHVIIVIFLFSYEWSSFHLERLHWSFREVLYSFDSYPRELVQQPDDIVSLEFQMIRSSTASVSAANPELGE